MGSTQDTQHSINGSSRKIKYQLGEVNMGEVCYQMYRFKGPLGTHHNKGNYPCQDISF